MATVIGYDEKVKKQVTCRNCSAIIEYVPKEVQREVQRDYDGSSDVVHSIRCPGCGEKVTVKGY